MQQVDSYTPEFIYVSNKGDACRIVDKHGEVIVDFCFGASPDEAFRHAYIKYTKAPKRATKSEIISENESLRKKIADMESGLDNSEASTDEAEEGNDPVASDDVVAKPVRKKKTRKRQTTPPPQATEFPHLS